MYTFVPQKKKDGSPRETWNAHRQLKQVHERIKNRFLRTVIFPLYLQGGILDLSNPRDYVRNAGIHAGQAWIVNEDITDFFPSTSAEQVLDIWKGLFRFPHEVALTLTRLTSRRGVLPQGAKSYCQIWCMAS